MPLIVRAVIVAVDDADRIVHLQPVFKAKPAARIKFQHPAVFDPYPHAGGDFDRLSGFQRKTVWREKVVACAARGSAPGQADRFVNGFPVRAERLLPGRTKLCFRDFFKSCDAFHFQILP